MDLWKSILSQLGLEWVYTIRAPVDGSSEKDGFRASKAIALKRLIDDSSVRQTKLNRRGTLGESAIHLSVDFFIDALFWNLELIRGKNFLGVVEILRCLFWFMRDNLGDELLEMWSTNGMDWGY